MTDLSTIVVDSHQAPNPAGARRVAFILAKKFTSKWPAASDITAGEVTGLPSAKLPALSTWALYDCPQNTIDVKSSAANTEAGFVSHQHDVSLDIAGFSKAIQVELSLLQNAPVVVAVEMADGGWAVAGDSSHGIQLTAATSIGKMGNDKRGTVLTGSNSGYANGLLPLSTSVIADLDFDA